MHENKISEYDDIDSGMTSLISNSADNIELLNINDHPKSCMNELKQCI